VNKVYAEER
jgi:hypothetical protein